MSKISVQDITINRVFIISLVFTGAIGAWGMIDPEGMVSAATGFTNYLLRGASWYWLLITTFFVALAAYMAFGPYGKIRLGKDDEEPEFSTASWIAMLFAGGMGAGLLFWGVAEPIYHFMGPPTMEGGTPQAAREAMVITMLHWGFHAWAIYGTCALVIAYFAFRRDAPSLISTPIRGLFKGKTSDNIGTAADVLGVLAVVFGLAGSLTMGALQVRAGMSNVFGTPADDTMSISIMAVLFVAYMLSATTGVDKGIKILSNINMVIALVIMLVVIFAGPTRFIFESFANTFGEYVSRMIEMSFRLFPYEGKTGWSAGWTLIYLIWWLAWGPFVGVFVARISRGRTIREFCAGVILVPTVFSVLWFAAFGGTAIYIELFGQGGIADLVFEDTSKALFSFLGYFPGGEIMSLAAIFLIFIFLVTSADSGTFVLSMMTTGGNLNPPAAHKLVWGTLIAIITVATLFSGSVAVAKAMAVTGALPFSVILLLQIIGFLREIRTEVRPKTRPIEARGRVSGGAPSATTGTTGQ